MFICYHKIVEHVAVKEWSRMIRDPRPISDLSTAATSSYKLMTLVILIAETAANE